MFRWVVAQPIKGERWGFVEGVHVSDHGRVRNKNGRVYLPAPEPSGYCRTRGIFIHKLVMMAFGPPRPTWATSVDHRNQRRDDNRIANLAWSDAVLQANNKNPSAGNETNKMKPLRVFLNADLPPLEFNSLKEAVDHFGFNKASASRHANSGKPYVSGPFEGVRLEYV